MTTEPKFLRRFEQIRDSLRRYQARLGLAATALVAATGLGLLAWSDYHHEIARPSRAIGLGIAALAVIYVAWRWYVAPLRWWTGTRTAAEIEGRFPQLGQRIRTIVQYAGRPDERVVEEGVKPSLVHALEGETEEQASPLPLDRVVRWRRAHALSALAAIPASLLAFAGLTSQEWRTAIQRALLIERPYTTVEVTPGNVMVDQGGDVPIAVELKGRPRKAMALQTRPAGKPDAPWKSTPIEGKAARREAKVEKVKDPVEYRVVAGPAESPSYAIRVRYPLAIKSIEVQVTPPAYTGLEPKTTKGGDVQAVEGSAATFRVAFDEMPSEASLELVDPAARSAKKGQPTPGPTRLPLVVQGDALVASLVPLVKDLEYGVIARTADGRVLPKKTYRIDVREDRAPRVVFDEPDEALEVHPIAEVRHRIRVDDDFGLTKAGIVFRFNDGEEKTLVFKDFPLEKGKKPKTTATLEEILMLETLNATPLDSVTYHGFAEDNYPGTPRRTETDLRYIDLRVFRREYKLAEPGSGDGDPQELIALDELIARQRVNLNRANRFAKHKPADRTEADDPLKIAGFEEALLGLTKDFTEGVEALADARVDSLHKALDAMQASIDALDRGLKDEVPPAMAEALKHLVAARRDLQNLIGENPALAAAMKAFDRRQAQKIRKPKSKDQEAEELVERIEELAQQEEFVYATIATSMGGTAEADAKDAMKGDPGEPKQAAKDPKEQGKEGPDAEKGQDADKGQDGKQGPEAEKGQESEKGQSGKGKAKGKGQGQGKEGSNGRGEKAEPASVGRGDDGEGGPGEPKKLDRQAIADKQQEIADEARDLEEKLKRLDVASDLSKSRMAKAADKVDKASNALTRGNAKEAANDAKGGAGMLHEVARQLKGEIAREAADELAMARDLADELARREAELADRAEGPSPAGSPGEQDAKDGKGKDGKEKENKGKDGDDGKGEDGKGKDGKGPGEGPKPGTGRGGAGGAWDGLTEAERIERMAEMARTLEAWLKQIDRQGEGKAADAVREILEAGQVAEIVERAGRMDEVRVGGKRDELGREARELAGKLERLGEALEQLHRGIVAPELAALVELDRRLAELTARLGTLTTAEEVAAWRRDAAELVRDLEKANVDGVNELADALRVAVGWHWDDAHRHLLSPVSVTDTLQVVSIHIKDRVQDLILKDLASARDEATPPAFRELVDRYYEVIAKGVKAK